MNVKQSLIYLARKTSVVIIDGPRYQDKLKLVLEVFQNKNYISFADSKYRELFINSPSSFFLAFPDGAIIDETQLVFASIDFVINEVKKTGYEPGKFILIYHGIIDRTSYSDVLTLLPEPKGQFKNPFEIILQGLDSDIDSIVEDSLNRINISNKEKFSKFIRLCASMNGKTLSVGSLAANTGITQPSAAKWLEILKDLGVVTFVEPSVSPKAYPTVKKPKLFFYNYSLLCALLGIDSVPQLILSPNLSEIVLAFTVSTLSRFRFNQNLEPKLFYYQERNGFKVDILAKWKHPWAFDVSSSIDAAKQDITNSLRYTKMSGNSALQSAVLYLGELTFSFNKRDWISYLDWEKLSSGLNYYS